jgi:hypothetical protein
MSFVYLDRYALHDQIQADYEPASVSPSNDDSTHAIQRPAPDIHSVADVHIGVRLNAQQMDPVAQHFDFPAWKWRGLARGPYDGVCTWQFENSESFLPFDLDENIAGEQRTLNWYAQTILPAADAPIERKKKLNIPGRKVSRNPFLLTGPRVHRKPFAERRAEQTGFSCVNELFVHGFAIAT